MSGFVLTALAWLVFVGAAVLEVGGDAVIRRGLLGRRWELIAAGALMLAAYGLLVNTMTTWDFARLLGVYVAVFAIISVLVGWLVLDELVPTSTWIGVGLIAAGGAVVQFGPR
jgi:small multidrug resistance family-3 protein